MQQAKRQCKAVNRHGTPCRATPLRERPYCLRHDPELAKQRDAWNLKGGQNRSNAVRAEKRMPGTLRETLDMLYRTLEGLESGAVPASRATAIASVARAVVAVFEMGEMELRLSEIEKQLAESSNA